MKLYHNDNGQLKDGLPSWLRGDCTGLRGDCSWLSGDCTGLMSTIYIWRHPITIYLSGKLQVGCRRYDKIPPYKTVKGDIAPQEYKMLLPIIKGIGAMLRAKARAK